MAKNQPIQKIANVFLKYMNPLRNLTQPEIERLLTNSRLGDDIKLQVAFYEMERSTPIFSICINKRIAGVLDREWDITTIDDSPEAKAQQETIKKMFDKSDTLNEDGLTEAIRHLCLATFRGRSAVKAFIDDAKGLHFKKLQNWNFVHINGKNFWNPSANPVFATDVENLLLANKDVVELPDNEVAYIIDDKPLDWSGISIYLRQLVGEEGWARCLEKFGIPQVVITAPEGTPETDLEKWNYRAQAIYEGGSGCLPNGSDVKTMTEARGQDPFSTYIQHQMEMFCILATGSTLATLGGTSGATGAGLGSDIASVQNDQFNSLVNLDCKRIANALSETVVKKCVQKMFKSQPCKVRFEFVEKDSTTPDQYLELASKAKLMGLAIDVEQLKKLTKLTFISDSEKDIWTPQSEGEAK